MGINQTIHRLRVERDDWKDLAERRKWGFDEIRALQKRVEELELDLCRAVQWKEDLLNTCDEKDEIIRQYEGEFDGLGKRVEELESTLRFMSGLLSTYGHWAGMHPQEVMDEVLKMSAEMGMKLERPRMGGEG